MIRTHTQFQGKVLFPLYLLTCTLLLGFLLFAPPGKCPAGRPCSLPWYAEVLLPLLALVLCGDLIVQFRGAVRETMNRKEPPPLAQPAPCWGEERFRRPQSGQTPESPLFGGLQTPFRRFYAFHVFEPPHLSYYYYSRKGLFSLFALPWIKAGFLLLFGLWYGDFTRSMFCTRESLPLLLLAVFLVFWLPGMLLLALCPYRRLWISVTEEDRTAHYRIITIPPCGASRAKKHFFPPAGFRQD